MNISIRPATEADVAFCAALEAECFSEPWSINSFTNAVQDADTYFFTALADDIPVGYYVAGNICDEVNLYTIAVSNRMRGKGIGNALLSHLIALSIEKNALFIGLEVRLTNTSAIDLYERNGFVLSGKRPGFYKKPTEDALLYTLFLNEENK